MNVLKRLLTPPVFEDELKTQQAFVLHVILWTLTLVPIPFLIYHLFFVSHNAQRSLIQSVIGESVNILLFILLRRGYVRTASILQVSAFWLFFVIAALTGDGIQGSAYLLGFSLVIAIAGNLLGGRGAAIFTGLSLLAGLLLLNAQSLGLRSDPFLLDPPLTTWVVSLVLFPVSAVLQHLGARAVRNALTRARSSEERYRLISRIASDYTFSTVLDAQGNSRLHWVAGAFEEITGYTYEEYVATGGWRAHLYPGDREQDDKDMQSLHANRRVVTEVRHFKKNGELRWARVYGHPIWDDANNRLKGIVGAVQDITGQKQAEEALRNSESIYRQAIEVAGAVPYHQTYTPQNTVIYDFIGDGIQNITGYSPAEFNEKLWDTLVIRRVLLDDLAEFSWDEAIERVRLGDRPIWKCEHCIRARDGKIRWVFEAAVELRDENGISHGSIGMFQDITERKLAEERNAQQQVMLAKVIDLGKQITQVSDLWTTLDRIWHGVHDELGFSRVGIFLYNAERDSMDGTLGTDLQGIQVRTPDVWFPVSHGQIFRTALGKPDGLYFTHNFDIDNDTPQDSEMYGVKDFAAVAAWAGEKPVAVLCVDNLLTENTISPSQLEALRLYAGYAGLAIENARLNASLQNELAQRQTFIGELEAKNAELERFTYTVSHDLKSPLVTIVGFLGYLERDALGGNMERVRTGINRISGAAKKMEHLLSDLLELSRIGRIMNAPENMPFAEIVMEALDRVRGRIEAVGIEVLVQGELPIVYGDRVRLVEIVQNLLDNAAKFSSGREHPSIKIGSRGRDENQHHILFVCDNGIGIGPEFHERIFGLFNKLDPQMEGTGIGLTLVKRIVEVHGGRIWVESTPDNGSTFYFTLPGQTN